MRARGIRPQPGQDQRPDPLTPHWPTPGMLSHRGPDSALRLFQVEVAKRRGRREPPTGNVT